MASPGIPPPYVTVGARRARDIRVQLGFLRPASSEGASSPAPTGTHGTGLGASGFIETDGFVAAGALRAGAANAFCADAREP